ncbi:protein translocase subunit SecD [Borrelia miyamotoi]|uniref:Protein translocase subunit SecD n=1 Tax=Borrelia miyamotoi TaxID=47466 RepID=A0AAQ3AFU5_9SPIR|nr:protein translocase subunit SecD [Borrelia miyamotoi]AGT27594.1 preprotein translocase subunit SecD [Borrelia miyamotoi LB-2001]AJA58766.1 preprotein translocase subunit SecD [Borrelia miyamotoi]AOW95849.1 protein-export membrane protein SecD [Borrelia miyamotoi]QTL83738.1 protein translocase subunit SecD [Borrelia miyamotoi]WAZ84957.1 protein translocase subunit SecD [Borrelia miyamotoi]
MNRVSKFILILFVTLFAYFLIFPTLRWYFFTNDEDKRISSYSKEALRDYSKSKALSSLIQLKELYQKDPNGQIPADLKYLIPISKNNYRIYGKNFPKSFNLKALRNGFLTDADIEELSLEIYRYYENIKRNKNGIIQLGLDLSGGMSITISLNYSGLEQKLGRTLSSLEKEDALERTMQILKERVDTFGLTEPKITKEAGGSKIFLDIPGEKDEKRIDSLLSGKGNLTFYVIDNEATSLLNDRVLEAGPLYSIADIKDSMRFGDNRKIFPLYVKDSYGIDDESTVRYYVVDSSIDSSFDGSHIRDAGISSNHQTGKEIVTFSLDNEGSEKFFELTQRNVGKALAVVMEGKIKSVANINHAIAGGNVSIQGDSFDKREANELALVFKTAAFPVEINIDDLRIIGPTIGEKTVKLGIKASLLALVLVFLFMFIYYKMSGFVAAFSLVIYNLFLILAMLSAFNFTLTLTSIAGLVLTMGMAVDINIIIYERIKEEIKNGRKFERAFEDGFKKAFWAIMDSNITTFIAVLFLTLLGTGPIQGFAWSLSIGIVASLFSSLIFSRFILEFIMSLSKNKCVSISWSSNYAKGV